MSAHIDVVAAGLAETGSDVLPWLTVGGVIVLLGVIALVVAGVVRSRRDEHEVEDAAERVAAAGGTLPAPDAHAPASDEAIVDEAAGLADGAAGSAEGAGDAAGSGGDGPDGGASGAGTERTDGDGGDGTR